VNTVLQAYLTPVQYRRIGVGYRLGERLRKIGVLRPDAMLDQRPIFIASTESFDRHKARVNAYRAGLFAARENFREGSGIMDKKQYSLSRALVDVYERGIPGGIEAEMHAELARNWPFSGGGTSRHPSLYVPFSALGASQRDMQVSLPNYGFEWIGRRDIVIGADLLISPSIVRQAGATVLTGLKTGASNLVPKRLSSETLVSRQLLVQGTSFEMILRNDLSRAFAWTLDYMALVGRGPAFFEPLGILNDPNVIVQPILPPDFYTGLMTAREQVALEGVDMSSFGFITNASIERLFRTTPKIAAVGDTDTWTAAGPIYSSPKVAVDRVFFGAWQNMVFGLFGGGLELILDPYTYSMSGHVKITGHLFADVTMRLSRSFGYSDVITPFAERNGGKKVS
jgi:hypothetical protein